MKDKLGASALIFMLAMHHNFGAALLMATMLNGFDSHDYNLPTGWYGLDGDIMAAKSRCLPAILFQAENTPSQVKYT